MMTWREQVDRTAQQCQTDFDSNAGDEVGVFEEGMHLLSFAVESSPGGVLEMPVAFILGQYYQLILSAWDNLRNGRVSAALTHERSLMETYEYASAALMDGDFASAWMDSFQNGTTIPVARARRVMRRELDKQRKGLGTESTAIRAARLKGVQAQSHISPVTAVGIFASSASGMLLQLDGTYNPMLRLCAVRFAWTLPEIVAVAYEWTRNRAPMEWKNDAEAYVNTALRTLMPMMDSATHAGLKWSSSLPGASAAAKARAAAWRPPEWPSESEMPPLFPPREA